MQKIPVFKYFKIHDVTIGSRVSTYLVIHLKFRWKMPLLVQFVYSKIINTQIER